MFVTVCLSIFFFFFFFGQESRICWWASVRRGQHQDFHECEAHHLSRGPWLGMYLTPTNIWDELLFCYHVFKFICIKLVNPHFLEMRIFFSGQGTWPCEKVKVAQLCLTLCDSMNYRVYGILQARILERVAFSFSRGSSPPRDQTQVSHMACRFFTSWDTREAL